MKLDASVLIEKIDAVPVVDYCDCGRPRSEHAYWEDRIYDYNGYRCPGSLGGDYRFDAVLTALNHKHARANELEAALAGVAAQIAPIVQEMENYTATPKGFLASQVATQIEQWADRLAAVQAQLGGPAIP